MIKVGQLFRTKMASSVKEGVASHSNAFVVTYTGISSAKLDTLRKDLRRKQADVLVSKTSVARLALKEAKYESLANTLNGQMALILSDSDASEVSKVLVKFAKDYKGFEVKGGVLDGAVLTAEQVHTLSDLPSREVLLAKLLGTLNAPITRFASGLNAKTIDFASILKQKSEKGGN